MVSLNNLSQLFFNKHGDDILLSSPLQKDSVVDGPGIRCVVWTQGCIHNCYGCHNPQTHSCNGGFLYPINALCNEIGEIHQNITLSGGDPFLQPEQCFKIASYAKLQGLNVWAYTGFKFEDLMNNDLTRFLLTQIDVLVDGKFEMENKSLECRFRGSTNQRLIDVQKSLFTGTVVEWVDPMNNIRRNFEELF